MSFGTPGHIHSADRLVHLPAGGSRHERLDMRPYFEIKARSEDTEGRLTVFLASLPPEIGEVPLHYHVHDDEMAYVLEGEMDVRVGDEMLHVTAGEFILLPKGVPHSPILTGPETAVCLVISAPGGYEAYSEELLELTLAGHDDNSREVIALRERYGFVLVSEENGEESR